GPVCPICDRRRAEESRVMTGMRRGFGPRPIRIVAAEPHEPRSVRALRTIGRTLLGRLKQSARLKPRATATRRDTAGTAYSADSSEGRSPESLDSFRHARLLLFGGKGGVGKTTVAAATAIRLARANRDARVLVLSTDPAHSLGDVFGVALSDAPTAVAAAPRNLLARELDAPAALAARRTGLEAALEEITRTFGVVAMEGGRGVRELLDLAPPGIDELFGILSIVEEIGISGVSRRSGAPPTIVVVGTAP